MPPGDKAQIGDGALGLNSSATRRDFLGSTLLASGAALLSGLSPVQLLASPPADDFTGYGGVGEYANSNGNTWPVLNAGHRLRDVGFDRLPPEAIDTQEIYDCVIVGGGISGLAAAVFFERLAGPGKSCLILENHPIFGGEAKQNEFLVDGRHLIAHQGSAIYLVPYPHSFIGRFYESIGLTQPKLSYQKWAGPSPELPLASNPYDSPGLATGNYGFWFGAKFGRPNGLWIIDPLRTKLAGAPLPPAALKDLLHFFRGSREASSTFEPPKYEGDSISRQLDSISLEQHIMDRHGVSQETVRTFLSPVEGGGSGLGPDALSAYCDYAADLLHPYDQGDGMTVQMFPGGNTTIARLMAKALVPGSLSGPATAEGVSRATVDFSALDAPGNPVRLRLNATTVHVKHQGDTTKASTLIVGYLREGKLYTLRARSAIMAGGSWTTRHTIPDLPANLRAAYAQFFRSPCLMANVALSNWRFLYKMGITGCRWFEGFGNYFDVRRMATTGLDSSTISPDDPVVLTLKVLYSYPGLPTADQGHRGRAELLTTSFRDYERQIREQFDSMFSASGFNAKRDIAGIILNRWGHAYLSPQPGFFFGSAGQPAPRDILRAAPFGRIAFANTDLAGIMDHRCSILEAHRAVSQLLEQVLP
jgi:spermidine dehydrogenase